MVGKRISGFPIGSGADVAGKTEMMILMIPLGGKTGAE